MYAFLCMYVGVSVCMFVCTYVYIYVCVCMYVCLYVYIYMCVCICIYIYILLITEHKWDAVPGKKKEWKVN